MKKAPPQGAKKLNNNVYASEKPGCAETLRLPSKLTALVGIYDVRLHRLLRGFSSMLSHPFYTFIVIKNLVSGIPHP